MPPGHDRSFGKVDAVVTAELSTLEPSTTRSTRKSVRPTWSPFYLALPALLFVLAFAAYPLASFLWGSISGPDGLTVSFYDRLLKSSYFFTILRRTLAVALSVTAICLLLAYPTAYAMMKARGRVKTVLIALVLLPYLTSVLVRTYAWSGLLALDGPINRLAVNLGILAEPRLLGHSDFGTAIGMTHILLPIAVLTMWSRFERMDKEQQTVAAALGATRARVIATVFVPQSMSVVTSAGVLVYVLALGAYVIPAALGGTSGQLFAQAVADQATQLLDWPTAGAMGTLMLVAAALPALMASAVRTLARRRASRSAPVITRLQHTAIRYVYPALDRLPASVLSGLWQVPAAIVTLFLVIPEIVVVVFSVGPVNNVTLPPQSWTLEGYRSVFSDGSWTTPLVRSLSYATADAVLATIVGALAAYGFARSSTRLAAAGITFLLLPIVLPEIVIAISYYIFANQAGLAGTDAGIVLGQGVGAVGLVVVVLATVIRQVDVNLEYAAQMCGASRWQTLRQIVLPLILPGLAVAFVYGFLTAFDNLVLPLFISGTKPTITVRMFLSMQESLTSAPAVIASLLIITLLAGIAIAITLQRTATARIAVPVELTNETAGGTP